MAQLFNRAGMTTTTAGQGTITLGSALGAVSINTAGFNSFASAGVADQNIVSYLVLDANGNWEVGTGTYTAAGTTLTRTVKYSSNSNTAISLSGSAQVFVQALACDGGDVLGGSTNPFRGSDTAVNLQLTASVAANALTIAVKGNNGSDPAPTNPVLVPFRATGASGDPVWVAITSASSVVIANGNAMGSANSVPFRFWIVGFNNSGTFALGAINCLVGAASPTQIFPLDEPSLQSSSASSGSLAAGVYATTAGLASKAIKILGYLEYGSGLATAGTYASGPTRIMMFGPGVKKPGEIVQTLFASGAQMVTSANSYSTGATLTPILTNAANIVRVETSGGTVAANALNPGFVTIFRGTVGGTQIISAVGANLNANTIGGGVALVALDGPGVAGAQQYTVGIKADGAHSFTYGRGDGSNNYSFIVSELMC